MSPPSSCTAGLMRVSSSSLIIATICAEQQQQAHERVCKQSDGCVDHCNDRQQQGRSRVHHQCRRLCITTC
jgi:hypothetical protein